MKKNEDNYNTPYSITVLDPKLVQLQSVTADDLTNNIIQVSAEDNNLKEKALKDTINKADREVEAVNCIK